MIKDWLARVFFVCSAFVCSTSYAVNLIEVYQQALSSDPAYQQAFAQKLSNQEGVPINLAGLLPSLSATVAPFASTSLQSGPARVGSDSQQGYNIALTLTQVLFDFGQLSGYRGAKRTSEQSDAAFNQATQDLMMRVSKTYFSILEDTDNLRYIEATRDVYAKQLDQVKQQFQVGLKTITDVYTAEASYQSAIADYIAAQNQLANDKENLRAMTGQLYPSFAYLRDDFPLVKPVPANEEAWVETSAKQNWGVKAAQLGAEAARQKIKQQFAGHLPTVNLQGQYTINYARNSNGEFGVTPNGSAQSHTSVVTLNVTVPLVQGGLVVAETNQAKYNYQVAAQLFEKNLREALNLTRQSYLGVILGISKINADKQAIKSSMSSYEGMEAGYRVGTEILVNVLDQRQKVVQAQQQYASDRYAYVNHLLSLKQAAGTLSPNDLLAINSWLEETSDQPAKKIGLQSKKTKA